MSSLYCHFVWETAYIACLVAVICPGISYADQGLRPTVRLDPIPELKAREHSPLTSHERERIAQLIDDLADVASPDRLLLWGTRLFLPVGGVEFGQQVPPQRISPVAALRKLVELGPKAMPSLLKALDDSRPTKWTLKREPIAPSVRSWLFFDHVLMGNPANPLEQKVLQLGNRWWTQAREPEDQIEAYRVKIGDVCLVAIGQIVGREYDALSHFGLKDLSIVICSPVHDRSLRSKVRRIWKSDDPAQKLLNSLLLDFATRGIVYGGEALDRWGDANDIQCSAIVRLLYYFPKESVPVVVQRLDKLEVSEAKDYTDQCIANGIRSEDFVEAVAWSKEPAIRDALRRLASRAKEREVVRALEKGGFKAGDP